jgi:serine/threonine-protein kinase
VPPSPGNPASGPVPPADKPIGLAADGDDSPRPAAPSSANPAPAAESSRAGSSLDTLFGRIVVERGLMSPEELQECSEVVKVATAGGSPRTLEDVLVEREFVTRRQVQRLRGDLEADRSSQRIPGYKIIRKLGAGAMATVFLGRQLSLDRLVAIKVLPKKFSSDPKFIERFYKEGRAAAKLNDPNIVGAYDVGQAGEHHYFVMEYVDGDTVYDRIVARKRVPEKEAIDIIRQVASALKHAHEQGFIHRDIKPKNLMINTSGVVKLADLGLARAISDKEAAEAESGRAFGTPYYISPEQIRGAIDIGPPADLYGLGATLYHMVTGRVPFEGKTPAEVMQRHLKAEITPPDHLNPQLSAGLAQVIEMMLAKNPKDRYPTAKELIIDLDLVARGEEPQFARPQVDFASVAQTAQQAPVGPVASVPSARPPLGLVIGLGVSVVLNLLLLAIALTR